MRRKNWDATGLPRSDDGWVRSGRVESREKMEMAEKGVLIPVDSRPIYTVGKHQRVKKMGVSKSGRQGFR